MADQNLTLNDLNKAVQLLRTYQVPPRKVKSPHEAKQFTANDPTGRTWHVGEEYYLVDSLDRTFVKEAAGASPGIASLPESWRVESGPNAVDQKGE